MKHEWSCFSKTVMAYLNICPLEWIQVVKNFSVKLQKVNMNWISTIIDRFAVWPNEPVFIQNIARCRPPCHTGSWEQELHNQEGEPWSNMSLCWVTPQLCPNNTLILESLFSWQCGVYLFVLQHKLLYKVDSSGTCSFSCAFPMGSQGFCYWPPEGGLRIITEHPGQYSIVLNSIFRV